MKANKLLFNICIIHLFSITFLTVSDTQAQQPNRGKLGKTFFGVNFSPDYCFRSLYDEGNSGPVATVRNDIEIPKMGFTTGVLINIPLSQTFIFETGLQYSNKGYRTKKQHDPLGSTSSKTVYSYHYIEAPLKVNLMIGHGPLRFVAGIGVSANYLIGASTKIISASEVHRGKNGSMEMYNRWNVSPLVSAGVQYHTARNLSCRLEPLIRYGLIKTTDTPVNERVWNFGLNMIVFLTHK